MRKHLQDNPADLLRLASSDYMPSGIWSEDDIVVARIKQVLSELPEAQRNMVILYAETGSVRDTAKMLGVSKSYFSKQICIIREQIISKL